MGKYKFFIIGALCFFLYFLPRTNAAAERGTQNMRVMCYNMENLFDCIDDPEKDDDEFLPESSTRHWTYKRYHEKLDHIARTIAGVGDGQFPAIVACCEIESDTCMYDLTRRSLLRTADYRYIKTSSPDKRGINVAILYQRRLFKPVKQESIRIASSKNFKPTRDILHVAGELINGDTLDVFVCHAPSRNGGEKETEPNRLAVARKLKQSVDEVMKTRETPQVIIMGDFNDYPDNRSIREVLSAVSPPSTNKVKPNRLYHLLAAHAKEDRTFGSYKYKGTWGLLDHLIVSGTLLNEKGRLRTSEEQATVYKGKFLLTDDKKYGGEQPFRTFVGTKYQNGYSDHLPIYADFTLLY